MNGHPFFSIVVPTYNRAGIIISTISLILKQSFRDFEIIVVDDGSSDNTEAVLQNSFGSESKVRILKQVNKERGAARNFGLLNARGEYVVFFDSDDIMHENHLEVLHKNINEQNFPLFIATKFDFVDENGRHFNSDMQSIEQGFYDYKLFLKGNALACNICVKKENPGLFLFEEDRRYSIKEDWMFMMQNLHKNKLSIIDKITISMADHPDRSMRSDNREIIKRTILASDWILDKIKLSPSEQKELAAHVNYFCGIHSYLDAMKKESIDYSLKAIKMGGIKIKYITLLLKSIIGRGFIKKLK